MDKCEFARDKVHFLSFIISEVGLHTDPAKIGAIKSWLPPTNLTELRSLHRLANFCRRFVKGFSTIMHPITECLKRKSFRWEHTQQNSFDAIEEALCQAAILVIPNFKKPFQVEVKASGLGVGAVLTQEGKPIDFFSDKLNAHYQKWST